MSIMFGEKATRYICAESEHPQGAVRNFTPLVSLTSQLVSITYKNIVEGLITALQMAIEQTDTQTADHVGTFHVSFPLSGALERKEDTDKSKMRDKLDSDVAGVLLL